MTKKDKKSEKKKPVKKPVKEPQKPPKTVDYVIKIQDKSTIKK